MRTVASVFSASAVLLFICLGSVAEGGEVLQAGPGQFLHIVVTITPSEGHAEDFHSTQISIGVTRIVFNDDGQATSVEGLNQKVEHLLGDDLEIISPTDKPVVKDGKMELKFKGHDGQTLLLPIPESRQCRISNADFLLNPIPKAGVAGFKEAPKGKRLALIVNVIHDNSAKIQLIVGVTRIEWDKDGAVTSVFGISSHVRTDFFDAKQDRMVDGKDLEITSPTDKLVAKDGIIKLEFKGFAGHKLPIRLDPKDHDGGEVNLKDAEWLSIPPKDSN